MITQRDAGGDNGGSVKVSIEISDSQQPVTFTCDGKQFFVTINLVIIKSFDSENVLYENCYAKS